MAKCSMSSGADVKPLTPDDDKPKVDRSYARDYRFWCILTSLCTMMLLGSLENTLIVTSLPYIVRELKIGGSYVWITNVFFLTW